MNVKLLYFAWVRERVGKPEETVEVPPGIATVSELMTWLASRGEEYAFAFENRNVIRAAINQKSRATRDRDQRRRRNRVFSTHDGRIAGRPPAGYITAYDTDSAFAARAF